MNNESYEEYIRSILGYPANNNMYDRNYNYGMENVNYANYNMNQNMNMNSELEDCYPEIYKLVYPMILKKCNNISGNLTKEEIENITDEIYFNIEGRNDIDININSQNNIRTTNNQTSMPTRKPEVNMRETEEKIETRQFNSSIRDLIKILLIRELIGRPGNFPPRPRPRPPMPGPNPRSPMRPNNVRNDMF